MSPVDLWASPPRAWRLASEGEVAEADAQQERELAESWRRISRPNRASQRREAQGLDVAARARWSTP